MHHQSIIQSPVLWDHQRLGIRSPGNSRCLKIKSHDKRLISPDSPAWGDTRLKESRRQPPWLHFKNEQKSNPADPLLLLRRLRLLDAMPPAPGRVGGIVHVTVRPGVLARLGHELVSHGAVLVVVRHPVSDVLLQLTSAHATLPAEPLAAHPQRRQVHGSVPAVHRCVVARRHRRGVGRRVRCLVPRPLQLIGSVTSDRQWHRPVHASVNRVQVPVGQTQAGRVNRVQFVKDGEVELRRQRGQCERAGRGLLLWRHWLIVHDGV